ncbi:MAG: hypothetical protein EOP92_15330 [Lysobacteraceae bacterium]|nr:MAG: hypothetical protein EOP92_15330 [Xanthomonadaceae bacterium]
MQAVLEFPSKIFTQWGAIAQEIASHLAQRGIKRDEICAVIERLKARWEQLESVPSSQGADTETSDGFETGQAPQAREDRDLFVSRHWRSQPARTLIEAAMADFQDHT